MQGNTIKWNITPHQEFLPGELGAWTVPPIRINRLSPSPDIEAEFVARSNFDALVDNFLRSVGSNWQPTHIEEHNQVSRNTPNASSECQTPQHPQGEHPIQEASTSKQINPNSRHPVWEKQQVSQTASPEDHSSHDTRQTNCTANSLDIPSTEEQLPSMEELAPTTNSAKGTYQDVRSRPHSRAKQRCYKRLLHPSRSHRKSNLGLKVIDIDRTENSTGSPHRAGKYPLSATEGEPEQRDISSIKQGLSAQCHVHCAQKLQEGSSESVQSEDQVESVQLTPNLQIDHGPAYARIDKQDGIG